MMLNKEVCYHKQNLDGPVHNLQSFPVLETFTGRKHAGTHVRPEQHGGSCAAPHSWPFTEQLPLLVVCTKQFPEPDKPLEFVN